MSIKTLKNKNLEKNGLDSDHFISIPENITKTLEKKGFFVYNWIGNQDIKHSIQRDFLYTMSSTLAQVFSVIFLIISAILFYSSSILFYLFFFGGIGIIIFLFVLYLSILSLKRAKDLRKNSYIVLTNNYISINGKIEKTINNKIKIDNKLKNISNIYEEKLFGKSNIKNTKKGLFKDIKNTVGSGYKGILKMGGGRSSKNAGQVIMFLLVIYSIYIFSIGMIYLIGIFFVWMFGILISLINKYILLISGHEITTIQNHFDHIDNSSKKLTKQKNNLTILINQAIENDWKNSLLTKIKNYIVDINQNAENAISHSSKLKGVIKNSKYNEMFDFGIYAKWIKSEIKTPLEQIVELLKTNLNKLKQNILDIEKKLEGTSDESFKGPLVASKTRTQMRIEEVEKHINSISFYIDKLK